MLCTILQTMNHWVWAGDKRNCHLYCEHEIHEVVVTWVSVFNRNGVLLFIFFRLFNDSNWECYLKNGKVTWKWRIVISKDTFATKRFSFLELGSETTIKLKSEGLKWYSLIYLVPNIEESASMETNIEEDSSVLTDGKYIVCWREQRMNNTFMRWYF